MIIEFTTKLISFLWKYKFDLIFYAGISFFYLESLRQKKIIKTIIYFLICNIFFFYYVTLFSIFQNLGKDSIREIFDFDLNEAIFWFKTVNITYSFEWSKKKIILYLFSSLFFNVLFIIFLEKIKSQKLYRNFKITIIALMIAIPIINNSYWLIYNVFINSQSYTSIFKNFKNPIPVSSLNKNLNVLLYIGESTSIMNMSLYGYHKKTTPELDALENSQESFLKFENVFSTHSHTSPSLLEALSIGLDKSENYLPIEKRRRISIIDILNQVDVNSSLVSNQGKTGSWNLASSIIFKNIKKSHFSTNIDLGNHNDKLKKPWDHELFNNKIGSKELDQISSSFIVFHSYAGHGNYLDNIPINYRKPINSIYQNLSQKAVTGLVDSLNIVESYDSTIKYIDFSVFKAITKVKTSSKPWVFVYTADHGESVFANLGHDSSRFIHEMVRVPFIIFFNDAAKNKYPELFNKYSNLSKTSNISTLSQLSSTLIDLLGINIQNIELPQVIGSKGSISPIMVRDTIHGTVAVNLTKLQDDRFLIDKTDNATEHYVISREFDPEGPLVCYHRSNTIAKVLRGSLVTNCLEIDIVVHDDNSILSYHPPAKNNTGLLLSDILNVVEKKKLSIWLDGKNLHEKKACTAVYNYLNKNKLKNKQFLLEFPTGSHQNTNKISSCIKKLKSIDNIRLSYYVSTDDAVNCSQTLKSNVDKTFDKIKECSSLKKDLLEMKTSNLFSDISFDFSGFEAIKKIKFLKKFSWNTWNVNNKDLNSRIYDNFHMIILNNSDPNTL